jgi:hypothetical protein
MRGYRNGTMSFNCHHVFRLEKFDTVLSPPHVDFKLVKKVTRDGKEYME